MAAADKHVRELTDDAQDPLAAFADWYLSPEHRDHPAVGCAVPTLGDDIRRGDDRLRTAYRQQVERYIAHVERFLGGGEDARPRAIRAMSTLVGALVLARAVDDDDLSDEILSTVRAAMDELP